MTRSLKMDCSKGQSRYAHCAYIPSVQRLATGWTVRGSNPGGGQIFRTRSDRPWRPPSLLYNAYRVSFPRVKRPGRGVNHPPTSIAGVKERVEPYLYSLGGPSWSVLRRNLHLHLCLHSVGCLSTFKSRVSGLKLRGS